MAIEIEKRFLLTEDSEKKIIDGALYIGEKVLCDIYYDNEKYELTTKDYWLRNRNGQWELKLPLRAFQERATEQYHELDDKEEIKKFLKLAPGLELEKGLEERGINPFATINSTRRKYRNGEFGIDLDMTDFGYAVAEIELMIVDLASAENSEKNIIEFALKKGLPIDKVEGKLISFLKNRPEHLQALIDAGVVQ